MKRELHITLRDLHIAIDTDQHDVIVLLCDFICLPTQVSVCKGEHNHGYLETDSSKSFSIENAAH
jgi:hypothetical protein